MKTLLGLVLLTSSLAAFAGPEEHKAAQTCYALTRGAAPLTENVPKQICLETISINLVKESLDIYSYFTPKMYKDMKLKTLTRKNEDVYTFKAQSVIFDQPSRMVCDSIEKVELSISGLVDNYGDVNPSELKILVKQHYTNDDCHLEMNEVVYQYILN